MEQFFTVIGIVFLSIVLALLLKAREQSIGLLLSVLVCTLIIIMAVNAMQPILTFIRTVQSMINLDTGMLEILLKCVGISITAEIAELICQDSGNGAMGKALQLFATAIISCLSIPLFTELLELIQEVISIV